MIKLLLAIFLGKLYAGSTTITYDDVGNSKYIAVTTYKLFARKDKETYDYAKPKWTGVGTVVNNIKTIRTNGYQSNQTYCFVLRAHYTTNNLDSPNSNEMCVKIPKLTPPSGFKLVNFDTRIGWNNKTASIVVLYMNIESGETVTEEIQEELHQI